MFTCDLVISYYKENLDWLNEFKNIQFRKIIIYTKGHQNPKAPLPYIEKQLDNYGRCDQTYLHHIVENYDDLPDVTIFTTGSASLTHKMKQLKFIVKKVFETHDSVFVGSQIRDVKKKLYNFHIDRHRSANLNNQEYDTNKNVLHKSPLRPFGKWYTRHFPRVKITMVNYFGVFAVSKKHILNHPQTYYQKLLAEFPKHSNPEVGHYFERAWLAVFHPVDGTCLYNDKTGKPRKTRKNKRGVFLLKQGDDKKQ
jgi:hypothetical protein